MKKKLSIFILLLVFFAFGVLFEHFKIFPRNYIIGVIKQSYKILKSPIAESQLKNNQANLQSCFNNFSEKNIEKIKNRILIIGHAYGVSEENNKAIYPKLIEELKKQNTNVDLIILTGDVVRNPSIENYKLAMKQLSEFTDDIMIAPGNHDVGFDFKDPKRKIFINFFEKFYDYRIIDNNLFLAVDTNVGWTISNEQFEWIKEVIVENPDIDRIFLLSHQTPWRYKVKNYLILDNIKKEHKINKKNKKLINFKKVDSFFEKLEKSIFYVSGTVDHKFSLFCETSQKFTYLASGVGHKMNSMLNVFSNEKKIAINFHKF